MALQLVSPTAFTHTTWHLAGKGADHRPLQQMTVPTKVPGSLSTLKGSFKGDVDTGVFLF